MNRLNRAAILTAQDAQYEDVEVPEWGGTVRIKAISAAERERWEQLVAFDKSGKPSAHLEDSAAKLLIFAAVDAETGERMFTEADIAELTKKNGKVMTRLWQAAARLNGLGGAAVKELEKN